MSRGTPADELKGCLKASYLWPNIEKLRLTTSVRVNLHGDDTASQFAATLLTLGNGQTPADDGLVAIPTTLAEVVTTTDQLKAKVFPNLAQRFSDVDYPQWMCERAILAPNNDVASNTNLQLLKQLPGNASSHSSIDRACGDSHDMWTSRQSFSTLLNRQALRSTTHNGCASGQYWHQIMMWRQTPICSY